MAAAPVWSLELSVETLPLCHPRAILLQSDWAQCMFHSGLDWPGRQPEQEGFSLESPHEAKRSPSPWDTACCQWSKGFCTISAPWRSAACGQGLVNPVL